MTAEEEHQSTGGMRGHVTKGLAWTGGSQAVMQVLRMVVAIFVARLLAPEQFGLATLAVVFSSLVLVFSDLALGAAVVQRKTLTEDDRCTAFWMAVGAGILFTIGGLLLAPAIAAFYGDPEVAGLCVALSFTFIITSLGATQEALLVRAMNFGALEQRTVLASLVGSMACVVVAIITRSAWAIIAQEVVYAVVSTVLLWKVGTWRPKWRFSRASLRELAGFSGYLVGHRLLYYTHRNADNILIGRFVGTAALGAYSIAYNIMLVPFSRLGGPLQKVLGPTLARMQDQPERIADAWVRVVRLLSCIAVPALVGVVLVAQEFVHVVLGEKWAEVAPLIQILAWVGILQALQTVSVDILQARGRTRTIFRFAILFCAVHLVAFVVGLQWGVVGVAAAYAISSTLLEPVMLWLTARSIGITPMPVLRGVRGSFEASAIMAVAVVAARVVLLDAGVGSFIRLLILVPLGALTYWAASRWRAPEAWADASEVLGPPLARVIGRSRRLTALLEWSRRRSGRSAGGAASNRIVDPSRPARPTVEDPL